MAAEVKGFSNAKEGKNKLLSALLTLSINYEKPK
jgi:hypothetical protein